LSANGEEGRKRPRRRQRGTTAKQQALRRTAMAVACLTVPLVAVTASMGPLAASADSVLTTVEDGDVGSDVGQVSYQGSWTQCRSCHPAVPDSSYRFSHDAGATATIRFDGTAVHLYGVMEPQGGVMNVQLDDRPASRVDTYSPSPSSMMLFSAGLLPEGTHTLVVTNTGERNPSASSTAVSFDRLESDPLPAGGATSTTTTATTTATATTNTGSGSAAAVSPSDHDSASSSDWAGRRSGQPWLSGANGDPRANPAEVDAFCNFRGSACDVALVYLQRDDWDAVSKPSSLLNAFANWPGTLVMSVPPFPDNVGGNLGSCSSGAYDGYFRTLGESLNAAGRQGSFIQLAWEPNGNWFPWSGNDPGAYTGCWRHVVDAIRATAEPDPMFCWCINGGLSQNPASGDPTELYPGDPWVDVIGTSAYDHYLPSFTQQQFDAKASARGGITWVYEFARGHGKQFGVSEWGVASGVGGGGDNAAYISWMRSWFEARAGQGLAYELYYNNCERNNVGSNLFRNVDGGCVHRNSDAAERYASLW
jgi:hypothetical protein